MLARDPYSGFLLVMRIALKKSQPKKELNNLKVRKGWMPAAKSMCILRLYVRSIYQLNTKAAKERGNILYFSIILESVARTVANVVLFATKCGLQTTYPTSPHRVTIQKNNSDTAP